MNKTPYEPIVINLADYFAFIVKKIVLVILFCFVSAALLLAFHYVSAGSEKAVEEYNFELESYNMAIEQIKDSLASLESRRASIDKAKQEDPASLIYDTGHCFISSVSFFISSENDVIISDGGVIVYPNQEKLISFFNSLNLSKTLGYDCKNEYLRKLVLVSGSNNHITITAYNQNKDDSEKWVGRVFDELYKYATEDNGWNVNGKTEFSEQYYGEYIIDIVDDYLSSLSELNDGIIKLTKELKDLQPTIPRQYHFLKFAVIGFIAGSLIAALILLLEYIKMNPVTRSFIAEKKTGSVFLGALFIANDIINKVSRSIIGERDFKSEASELEFIRENIRNTILPDKSIKSLAILSSCQEKSVEKAYRNLESVFSELGYEITLVSDAAVNPNSTHVISCSDVVVLLERQWVSQWKNVEISMNLVERFNKSVLGFVLC